MCAVSSCLHCCCSIMLSFVVTNGCFSLILTLFLPTIGYSFNLKVQVSDMLSQQSLSQTVVDVYVNYTRAHTALTGDDGGILLNVPYRSGLPITVMASKDGYVSALLPCVASRMPIFSSVTMSLLGLNQGNLWFFEESVLITGKTSDSPSQPVVRFPRSLLNLTDNSNVTSVKAYLTIPKLTSDDGIVSEPTQRKC
uniref:FAM171 N-terminal domain-containing protein n=1 Tax=Echeneis naucrates TaxID=173247 RepID=A0A665VFC3_ECHNA